MPYVPSHSGDRARRRRERKAVKKAAAEAAQRATLKAKEKAGTLTNSEYYKLHPYGYRPTWR